MRGGSDNRRDSSKRALQLALVSVVALCTHLPKFLGACHAQLLKELMLKTHPDKNRSEAALATQAFQLLQQAFKAFSRSRTKP